MSTLEAAASGKKPYQRRNFKSQRSSKLSSKVLSLTGCGMLCRKRSVDIAEYVKKSMLENPWKELEKQPVRRRLRSSDTPQTKTAPSDCNPCVDRNLIPLDTDSDDAD